MAENTNRLQIGEVSRLTGISVRTLQYYDEIGLLPPSDKSSSGYRYYDAEAMAALQEILFFRELDFSLADIKRILADPGFDRAGALLRHRKLLLAKKTHVDALIESLDSLLRGMDITERNTDMKQKKDYNELRSEYAKEAEQLWGKTPEYAESVKKTSGYSESKFDSLKAETDAIFAEFGDCAKRCEPSSEEAQALLRRWQAFITKNYYKCSDEMLKNLALMYTQDERFKAYIDGFGEGSADFIMRCAELL